MRGSKPKIRKSRLNLLQDEKRELSRHTPLVTSDKQAMKIIGIETRYFFQYPPTRRPQIIEESFNEAFLFYKYRRVALDNNGEECRKGLLKKMTSKHLKKFIHRERIFSEYGISMSGSKALQAGVAQEIQMKLMAHIHEVSSRLSWRSEEWRRDLKIDLTQAIDTLPSFYGFIIDLFIVTESKTEVILILESNEIKNGRVLVKNAVQNLKKQLQKNGYSSR